MLTAYTVNISVLRDQEICSLASGSGGYACTPTDARRAFRISLSAGDMLLAIGVGQAHGHRRFLEEKKTLSRFMIMQLTRGCKIAWWQWRLQ